MGQHAPLKRARIMFNYKALLEENLDALAEAISTQHGKTKEDARGEVIRGIEVVEFACGIPHLLRGDYTRNVGPAVDSFSDRQPLGVVAGITPFNFPAMVPMWMFPMAIACGNTFILKPSERDPAAPQLALELLQEAGLPKGVMNIVNGGKDAVDAILHHKDIKAVSFVGSTPIAEYVYTTGTANGKRVQALGGAKNHMVIMPDADMDQAVDALMGAGYGSAGERCMAISVAVPVGEQTADRLIEKLAPRVSGIKIGPWDDPDAEMGPLITKDAYDRVSGYIDAGVKEGADLVVDGRGFSLQGMRTAISSAAACSTMSPRICRSIVKRFSARWSVLSALTVSIPPSRWSMIMNTATGQRSLPVTVMPPAPLPTALRSAWSGSMCRSGTRRLSFFRRLEAVAVW